MSKELNERSVKKLITELKMQKEHFFYHKAIIPFIPSGPEKVREYEEAPFYRNCGIKIKVSILKGEKTREEHNKITHSINEWFVVYCAVLVMENTKNYGGRFVKVPKNSKISLIKFSHCQLLYILRDKLAHNLYKSNSKGKDLGPYSAMDVSKEIQRRYGENIDDFALLIDKVIIPMINGCILEIKSAFYNKNKK